MAMASVSISACDNKTTSRSCLWRMGYELWVMRDEREIKARTTRKRRVCFDPVRRSARQVQLGPGLPASVLIFISFVHFHFHFCFCFVTRRHTHMTIDFLCETSTSSYRRFPASHSVVISDKFYRFCQRWRFHFAFFLFHLPTLPLDRLDHTVIRR